MPSEGVSRELLEYFIRRTDNKLDELETHIDHRLDRNEQHLNEQLEKFQKLFDSQKYELEQLKLFKARMMGASIAVSTVVSIAGWALTLIFGAH